MLHFDIIRLYLRLGVMYVEMERQSGCKIDTPSIISNSNDVEILILEGFSFLFRSFHYPHNHVTHHLIWSSNAPVQPIPIWFSPNFQPQFPPKMSASTAPSRMLLSSFRSCMRWERSISTRSFSTRCLQHHPPTSKTTTSHHPRNQNAHKPFSTSTNRTYKTVQEQKSRYRSGVRRHFLPPNRISLPT